MPETPAPFNTALATQIGADHVAAWVSCGRQRVAREKILWLGMALVYLTLAVLLELIPFMGHLVLILLTPLLLAGVLLTLQAQDDEPGHRADETHHHEGFQLYLAEPARQLFQIFRNGEKVFNAVTLSIIVLGLAMLVKIIGYLLVGGSMVSGLTATDVATLRLPLLLGTLVVSILYFALTFALLYCVPLTVLANRLPLVAIAESFAACKQNIKPLALFVIVFIALPYILISAVLNAVPWLGYLLLVGAGITVLPVVVASAYCSYLSLFPALASAHGKN